MLKAVLDVRYIYNTCIPRVGYSRSAVLAPSLTSHIHFVGPRFLAWADIAASRCRDLPCCCPLWLPWIFRTSVLHYSIYPSLRAESWLVFNNSDLNHHPLRYTFLLSAVATPNHGIVSSQSLWRQLIVEEARCAVFRRFETTASTFVFHS